MQRNTFVGNAAGAFEIREIGDKAIGNITLLSNEYAGTDKETNETKERTVSIRFTAFGKMAERLQKLVMKGDQLIVDYRIQNSEYEKDGVIHYGFNFIILDFELGAPGKAKREQFNNQ
ncbi:single-stranded DNA-binding protein [Salmonella enterica]